MSAVGLMPMSYRIIGVVVFLAVLSGGSAALRWRFQDWHYGRQLAEQAACNELSPSPMPGTAD